MTRMPPAIRTVLIFLSQEHGQRLLILSKKHRTIQNINFLKNSYYQIATNNSHSAGSVSGMLRSIES